MWNNPPAPAALSPIREILLLGCSKAARNSMRVFMVVPYMAGADPPKVDSRQR